MSDENEHTSEEAEAEMNAGNNQTNEQSKSDASMLNNGTEQPMLEDEEMPTYISVSSPSRREDSDVNVSKQQERVPMEEEDHSRSPYPSDGQGGGSIYVLSSGEESNRGYNDDEEDEYADSEDMDEMDLENEHDNIMLEDEEEEDDEEDEDENPLRLPNDDDEDIGSEYDPEYFDRASDDFILNNRVKHHHKERSLSLQDLSFSKSHLHPGYNKKRHSMNIFRENYLDLQHNAVVYPVAQKKQSAQVKYQHVESKVKQYIKDIKEQNRKSLERRSKEQEYVTSKNHRERENSDGERLKPTVTNRAIKDYAEKAIKDLQLEENAEDADLVYNTEQIVENGESNRIDNKVTENQYKHLRKDAEMNPYADIENEKHVQNCDDRLEKRNGSVNINEHRAKYPTTVESNARFNNLDQPSLINGHQQTPTLLNLRTLSYEEYMHGATNNEQEEELAEEKQSNQEEGNKLEAYNEVEMLNAQEIENSNVSISLKIESVKSIRVPEEEPVDFVRMNVDKRSAENIEVFQLKSELEQKDAQFNSLRNTYQKTLAENIRMKQELDALKKSLAEYENENKTPEMKVASVQTDAITEPTQSTAAQKSTTSSAGTNNKVSVSSVASTISSIDHWADSACSPAISVKPPDVTSILNSDDSIVLTDGTPRRIARPLSRAFITSSRILQTLSNITQGKTKVESPLVQNPKKRLSENPTDRLSNVGYSSPIQASSSKKRKATDMLDTSAFAQPFKIPNTTSDSDKKSLNDTASADFKFSGERASLKPEQQQHTSLKNNDGSTSVENPAEETNEQEESVKCFIYRDGDDSKNRSFLIQAEEPTKDKLENEKNRIQECGPYLLGNLEVRMSEINGTISVWGKEINEECASDNEEEDAMDISIKSSDRRSYPCCQKSTPQPRFNGSPLVCSTSKKLKIPLRLNRSSVSQCYHASSLNAIKSPLLVDDVSDKKRMGNGFSPIACVSSCENCDSVKHRKEWPMYKGTSSSQEKLHSCCTNHTEFIDKECNCSCYHEKQKYDDSPNLSRDKFHSRGIRRSSCRNTSDANKHLRENFTNATPEINELICNYNTCRRSFPNVGNNNSHSTKYGDNARNVSCTRKSSLDNIHNHNHSGRQTCRQSLSNDGDEDPLISVKQCGETPEIRQRRLSGKKVRGILMDLLRGCGDCRSSTSGASKSDLHQKQTFCTANGPPQIKISRCPTPERTCSNSTQCNDRCCHTYARRIESQLEEFRMEMERVRSRSDAILDMLNMLHSVDTN